MSCGFINNKYGVIFTKLFRGRKGWQLRRHLHGNCKKVINKAWSRDLWKYDSEGNENNLTKYYPSPYLTWGQLKKRCQLWWTACWALKLQLLAFSFVWLEAGSNIQVEENVFMPTQTMCLVWMNIKLNKINLITYHQKRWHFSLRSKLGTEWGRSWGMGVLFCFKTTRCCGKTTYSFQWKYMLHIHYKTGWISRFLLSKHTLISSF